MSKVYRIAWNVTTDTWTVASETVRFRGRGSFCVTLSGIAAAVSLGVPCSRIAQAAPSASYMVAAAGEASVAPDVAGHRVDALAAHNDDDASVRDFWRIVGAGPAAAPDDRPAGVRRVVQRRRQVARAKKPGVAAANVSTDEKRTHGHQKKRALPRRVKAHAPGNGNSEVHGNIRYDSPEAAMSVQFYNVIRRPGIPDSGHMAPALMTGAGFNYFDTMPTKQVVRVDTQPASAHTPPPDAPEDASRESDAANGDDTHNETTTQPDDARPVTATGASPADPSDPVENTSIEDGTKIASIHFDGNTAFSSEVLLDEMQLSATNWTSWYSKDNAYSKDRLSTALEGIRRHYLDHGYLAFRTESVQTSPTPDGSGVSLAITLHEGPQYTLSAIELAGSPPGLEAELETLLQNRVGQPVSIGKLLATRFAMLDRLGADGYTQATVNPLMQPDPSGHTIDLTLQIEPGTRAFVRHIEVTGNTLTRDEVVRRELRQREGEAYDAKKIVESRKRLDRLGYFSRVELKTVPVKSAPDEVDILVKVAEKPDAPVSVSAGYSSTERFVASAAIAHDNVLGTGTSAGAAFSIGKSFRSLSVGQSNPYFTAGGVRRTTRAYYRSNEPLYYSGDSRFKVETAGVDLRFSLPAGKAGQFDIGAAVEHHRLTPDGNTPPGYVGYIEKHGRESGNVPVTVGWSRDRLDNAASPKRGYIVRAAVEYGTPAASNRYYKADVDARWYRAFAPGVVLGAGLQGGYGGGIGSRPWPIVKNYYAGGIGSVRGYEPGSLSPRDPHTHQPVGGSKMLTGSVELKVPLPGAALDSRLGAFAFVDGGNVWGSSSPSVGSNGMRFSYGAGFSWGSPIGAFKVSVGLPMSRHPFDRYQKVQMQFQTEI